LLSTLSFRLWIRVFDSLYTLEIYKKIYQTLKVWLLSNFDTFPSIIFIIKLVSAYLIPIVIFFEFHKQNIILTWKRYWVKPFDFLNESFEFSIILISNEVSKIYELPQFQLRPTIEFISSKKKYLKNSQWNNRKVHINKKIVKAV
jgi:hypothetical protein